MNRLREGGIADASAKICRPRRSPTTMSSSPTATIRRVVAGIRLNGGCLTGKTSPGMIATRARGVGIAAWGSEERAATRNSLPHTAEAEAVYTALGMPFSGLVFGLKQYFAR